LMFINYRRRHTFSQSDKSLIRLFADIASMYLKYGASSKKRIDANFDLFADAQLQDRDRPLINTPSGPEVLV
jgi:hypothetical protein